ncbi:MAG: biotin/lipoyl-binding protein, partial [Candidatus Muiribacteriota bacterium]
MKKYIYTIIVLLILGGGFYYYKNHQAKKAEANKPEYMTAEVSRKDIAIKVLSTGSLQPFTRVEVKGTIRGRIDEVFVNEGSVVKRGDVLATISSEERNSILDAADSMLRTARASGNSQEIREAQAALEIAQNAYKTVTILSSMEGEIISRTAEPGQNVDTSFQ